jgi:hypothetical protein
LPRHSVINLIGACLGRALAKHPIRIHWFECNLHHLHIGFSVDDDEMRGNVVPFFRMVASGVARQTNRLWARENHVFGERYRATPCLDDDAAEQQMLYALSNAVKDGQVEHVSRSPFFSTVAWHRMDGASAGPHRYWFIDYAGWWRKGGPRKGNRLKDFLAWIDVEIAPLPHLQALSTHQRQTRLRHQLREIERTTAERLVAEGRTAAGFETLRRLDPRDRPRNPKTSGRQPLCHVSDPAARKMFIRDWRVRLRSLRELRRDRRPSWSNVEARRSRRSLGGGGHVYGDGSYRPPLITPYSASCL